MSELKYTIIKSKIQYRENCRKLEDLAFSGTKNKAVKDEVDLLTGNLQDFIECRIFMFYLQAQSQ